MAVLVADGRIAPTSGGGDVAIAVEQDHVNLLYRAFDIRRWHTAAMGSPAGLLGRCALGSVGWLRIRRV
ncbi:MAG TPA: hypothetical protein VJ757_09000 [Pseudonocardiaceae bacterium]|nr:hypothetical protein [Pseudonocardiaceae bacterium]